MSSFWWGVLVGWSLTGISTFVILAVMASSRGD